MARAGLAGAVNGAANRPWAIRPLRAEDVPAIDEVQYRSFVDLASRLGEEPVERTPDGATFSRWRIRHLLETDPDGAWVAEGADGPVGVALALRRGGLWGLSLLAVAPAAQGSGAGAALLDAALSSSGLGGIPGPRAEDGATVAVILASLDPRAMRRYALAGFDLHPQVRLTGSVDRARLAAGTGVRAGTPADLELVADVDIGLRGASHGPDFAELLTRGLADLLVLDDGLARGYAVLLRGRRLLCLGATAPQAAARLLTEVLATITHEQGTGDRGVEVNFISAGQDWAVQTGLRAGLVLRPEGPVFWRGRTPPSPYLPSGPFL